MNTNKDPNWKAISGLISELKRCDEYNIPTASIAMTFICIDTLANLNRPIEKQKATRNDFIEWVNNYLKTHPKQPYQYIGKDVYAARCAFLHTYGSDALLHKEDSSIKKYGYHDGGKHAYNPDIEPNLVLIGTKSFINDVIHAAEDFIENCLDDQTLRSKVESRLPNLLQINPFQLPRSEG